MTKCANCGKELKWYQVAHPMLSREPFCQGLKCWKEYNKKKKEGLIKAEDKKPEDSLSRGIKFAVGIILVIILFFWLFQPKLVITGEVKPIVNDQNNYIPETSNPSVAPQTTSTNTTQNNQAEAESQKTPAQVSLGADFCELKNLKLIIPDRIDCIMADSGCLPKTHDDRIPDKYLWKDGTEMNFVYSFAKADRAGQNINYLYSGGRLEYRKTPIQPDRTIGETVKHEIDLAISPNDKTSDGYKVTQYRCCNSYCTDESYKMIE
jgi:hypothetical protein